MKLRSIALVLAGFGLVAVACSSSSTPATPTPCNENPWECGAGQTCWPKDLAGDFQCLNSGAGKKGDACSNTVGAPTCGDGLACLSLVGASSAYCTTFCDPTNAAHACATGETCGTISLSGTTSTYHVCVVNSTPQTDAGAETATDAGAETATDAGAETAADAGAETAPDAASSG